MFTRHAWNLFREDYLNLGRIDALVKTLVSAPLTPEIYAQLRALSFKKGALATTALENNTITDKEYDRLARKEKLPASREYQAREVENMKAVFESLAEREALDRPLTCELIQQFHARVMAGFTDATPGRWRERNVTVANYRAPDYARVSSLMAEYCGWLQRFRPITPERLFEETLPVILAAHVFFEKIHPFQDGNGRTGRLIEYYLSLQAGLPITVGHILSNHYNNSRTEYGKYLGQVTWDAPHEALPGFITYALTGLADGLSIAMKDVQTAQEGVFWQKLIHEALAGVELSEFDKARMRKIISSFPLDNTGLTPADAAASARVLIDEKTLGRDLAWLKAADLLWEENGLFYARYEQICPGCLVSRKEEI